jgi:hypothetical protein
VHVVYPHSKLASAKVHAFAQHCAKRLREAALD